MIVSITTEHTPVLRTRFTTAQGFVRCYTTGQFRHHRTVPEICRMSCRTMPKTSRHPRLCHHHTHRILRPSYSTLGNTIQLLRTSWWIAQLNSFRSAERLQCLIHELSTTIG